MSVRATLAVMLAVPLLFLAIAALGSGGGLGSAGAGAGSAGAADADTTRPAISHRCEQVYGVWDCLVSWTAPPTSAQLPDSTGCFTRSAGPRRCAPLPPSPPTPDSTR